MTPESVGQSRAAASLAGLQELNEFVSVRTVPTLDEETVARHQAAVFIGQPRADLLRWNEFCRTRGIAFYAAGACIPLHGGAEFRCGAHLQLVRCV